MLSFSGNLRVIVCVRCGHAQELSWSGGGGGKPSQGQSDRRPNPASKRLLEGSVLSASLLADIQHKKFCLHQPFYHQQVELKRGHGLDGSRNMLCHWNALGAESLEPLYKIHRDRRRKLFLGAFRQRPPRQSIHASEDSRFATARKRNLRILKA